MESAKVYTTAEIEKIEQEVAAYKSLLKTLKLDTSLEDYSVVKNEFEALKMQMEQEASVKEAIDSNPSEPIEPQDNQVEQVSVQLASLSRMVEEVLATLNKAAIDEVKQEQAEDITAPDIIPPINEAKQHEQQVKQAVSQPTYHQLRNLAGKSSDYQKKKELPKLIQHTKNQLTTQQHQRHFNVRYFQSTQTQPNNMYNGLYKNMRVNVSSKLKNIGPVISNEIPASSAKNNQLE